MVKIAPSILAADINNLAEEVKLVEEGGADFLHFDIMDGRFVPNISFGPVVVKNLRAKTSLPFETHLMVEMPNQFIIPFVQAGTDMITVHVECFHQLYAIIKLISSFQKKVGLALNPSTPLSAVEYLLTNIDMLLLMTVDPGFSGQCFILEMLPKIKKARQLIDDQGLKIELAIDGGVDEQTAPLAVKEGVDILIAGSAIFSKKNPKEAIGALRRSVK
ncbi:MAG: ribulose-phosphate 3-epimerase [Candidatus Bathyarchaeota archaeon]